MAFRLHTMRFLFLSLIVHFGFAGLSEFLFEIKSRKPPEPTIRVRLIKNRPAPNVDFPIGKIIDTPPPVKEEKPQKAEILAAFDSKSNSGGKRGKRLIDEISIPKKKAERIDKLAKLAPVKRPATASVSKKSKKPLAEKKETSKIASIPDPFARPRSTDNDAADPEKRKVKYKKELDKTHPEPKQTAGKTDSEKTLEKEVKEGLRLMSGEEIDFFIKNNPDEMLETNDEMVIPLNTRKFEYLAYFSAIRRAVETVWFYPNQAMINGIGGQTLVRFTIVRDGWMEEAKIISSSGETVLDKASVMAVRGSAPFPPFPSTLTKKKIHVVATFTYKPVFSAVP